MDKVTSDSVKTKYKIGVLVVCTGFRYWPYVGPMIESAKKHFLTNHDVTFFMWSDCDSDYGATKFEAEDVGMPWATLLRYHWFLQKEDILKEFDYLFYVDADMLFTDTVGDEVLSKLTAVQHPGYAFAPPGDDNSRSSPFFLPFERNPNSKAYVPSPRYYFAGGFQGGESGAFISAMKVMRQNIDEDFSHNYIAMWHDESHWNKYLIDNPPEKVLDPGYCYPETMVEEFYKKVWRQDYHKRLVALHKGFLATAKGGEEIRKTVDLL